MFLQQALNLSKFGGAEAKISRQNRWMQPEFGRLIVAIHVYMRRFIGFVRMEIDAIWTRSPDRRHDTSISPLAEMSKSRCLLKPDARQRAAHGSRLRATSARCRPYAEALSTALTIACAISMYSPLHIVDRL